MRDDVVLTPDDVIVAINYRRSQCDSTADDELRAVLRRRREGREFNAWDPEITAKRANQIGIKE